MKTMVVVMKHSFVNGGGGKIIRDDLFGGYVPGCPKLTHANEKSA